MHLYRLRREDWQPGESVCWQRPRASSSGCLPALSPRVRHDKGD